MVLGIYKQLLGISCLYMYRSLNSKMSFKIEGLEQRITTLEGKSSKTHSRHNSLNDKLQIIEESKMNKVNI